MDTEYRDEEDKSLRLKRKLDILLGGVDDGADSHNGGDKLVPGVAAVANETVEDKEAEAEDGVYTFKLFSAPSTSAIAATQTTEAQRISLRSPSPPSFDYAQNVRPLSCYLTKPLTLEEKRQYESAAVDGGYVLDVLAKRAWTGLRFSWRVMPAVRSVRKKTRSYVDVNAGIAQGGRGALGLPVIYGPVTPTISIATSKSGSKRTRPGKKSRLILRKRADAARIKEKAHQEEKADGQP